MGKLQLSQIFNTIDVDVLSFFTLVHIYIYIYIYIFIYLFIYLFIICMYVYKQSRINKIIDTFQIFSQLSL